MLSVSSMAVSNKFEDLTELVYALNCTNKHNGRIGGWMDDDDKCYLWAGLVLPLVFPECIDSCMALFSWERRAISCPRVSRFSCNYKSCQYSNNCLNWNVNGRNLKWSIRLWTVNNFNKTSREMLPFGTIYDTFG